MTLIDSENEVLTDKPMHGCVITNCKASKLTLCHGQPAICSFCLIPSPNDMWYIDGKVIEESALACCLRLDCSCLQERRITISQDSWGRPCPKTCTIQQREAEFPRRNSPKIGMHLCFRQAIIGSGGITPLLEVYLCSPTKLYLLLNCSVLSPSLCELLESFKIVSDRWETWRKHKLLDRLWIA